MEEPALAQMFANVQAIGLVHHVQLPYVRKSALTMAVVVTSPMYACVPKEGLEQCVKHVSILKILFHKCFKINLNLHDTIFFIQLDL